MKKYFMKGTNDEVQFGDIIQLDLTKRTESGKVKHKHFECELQPGIADYLVEEDVLEVRESKEKPVKQTIINFEFDTKDKGSGFDVDKENYIECLFEGLSKDLDSLCEAFKELKKSLQCKA